MNVRWKSPQALMAVVLVLSTPVGAQLFDNVAVRANGLVEAGDEVPHPKRLTVSMPVPAAVEGQKVCLSYLKFPAMADSDSRVKARCSLWRGDSLVSTGRFNGAIEFDDEGGGGDGWGHSRFCSCGQMPLAGSQLGDVLQCEIRFRRLPMVEEDTSVSTTIAIVESPRSWCAGF